ncbi:MAG: dynamin family protein [Chloroflexi bacterium]|nr:dynamin family protein [Chloroflexota bacterium]
MSNLNLSNSPTVVLEGALAELRERLIRLLGEAAEFVGKLHADGAQDRQRLRDAADDLRELFLLVAVIGEFNAGKSTFINALLGEPLLPMGITPTTDVIELVHYAPVPNRVPRLREGAAIREWEHPGTGGVGIAIVDTPGTGSIFKQHEEIAKSFLHRSDLVLFVISAKRAFAETERLYLELARSYGKKIVIVINQADLLDDAERQQVREFVRQQIDQLLGLRPPIFMVSAKQALQRAYQGGVFAALREMPSDDPTGILALAAHLRQTFEQVPPAKQKLLTRLSLLRSVLKRHEDALNGRLALIGQDTDAAHSLEREIEQHAAGLDRQLEAALEEIRAVIDGILLRGGRFMEKNLNVLRAAFRGMDRDKLAETFDREVLADSLTRLAAAQESYVNALVDSGRAYWRSIIERLSKLEALLREEATGLDAAQYADQRAALQAALAVADVELRAYADHSVLEAIESSFDQNVRTFIYGTIAGIGGAFGLLISALTAAATPGTFLPPLGVLTLAIGIIALPIGGGVAFLTSQRARKDALKQLEARLSDLEKAYRDALSKLTAAERSRLTSYGKQILAPVFSQLGALAARYRDQQTQLGFLMARVDELEKALDAL